MTRPVTDNLVIAWELVEDIPEGLSVFYNQRLITRGISDDSDVPVNAKC